jgi:pimeloyl-ACP methyl ester carboxylesterase
VRTSYRITNGIRIFCTEAGPDDGPLVLLCHGFPESWYSWRHQLEPLGDAGFHAVAIDLPGYGRSDKPDVTYDITFVNACIAGLIPAFGRATAVLAGHDWGGLLVWPFARMYPERTAGIIGVNTPDLPRGPKPLVQLLRDAFPDNPPYIVQFQERGHAEYFIQADIDAFFEGMFGPPVTVRTDRITPEDRKTFADDFRVRGAITPPLEYYRNIDNNWHLTADVADRNIDVPCLMICAEGDPVLTPAMADGMEERVPDLEKVVISDCGHWTQQEQPEACTEAMLAYVNRLPAWS